MASITGRMVNIMMKRMPGMAGKSMRRQVAKYRASNGTKGNKIMGKPVFLLDVVGRTSGEARPVMLMHVPHGDDLVVTGSMGGADTTPNWYKNLLAAGKAHAEVGGDRWAVTARELEEGPERDECWSALVAAYPDFGSYQTYTSRRLPVALLSRTPD
jgi:deazaflavin-dependent oxidoreductase (nitroreductase family)